MKFAKQRQITLKLKMCSVSIVSVKKTHPLIVSTIIGSRKDKKQFQKVKQHGLNFNKRNNL